MCPSAVAAVSLTRNTWKKPKATSTRVSYRRQVIELKNALLQNQKNAQARWLLGKVDLDIGDAAAAEKELRHASELGVADGAVLPILAQALLAQGKYEELQALSLETLTTEDQKAVLLASQGLGKLAQGEVDAAEEKIEQAVSMDPRSPYAGVAKARLLATKQQKIWLAMNWLAWLR